MVGGTWNLETCLRKRRWILPLICTVFIVLEVFVIAKEYVILHRFLRSCLHTWFRNEGLFGFFIERTIKNLWILRKCYCKLSFAYNHVCWQAAPYEKSIHLFERLVKLVVISAFFPFERFFSSVCFAFHGHNCSNYSRNCTSPAGTILW